MFLLRPHFYITYMAAIDILAALEKMVPSTTILYTVNVVFSQMLANFSKFFWEKQQQTKIRFLTIFAAQIQ